MGNPKHSGVDLIEKFPPKVLGKILSYLSLKDQREAALVNHKWFDVVYKNPLNQKVVSLWFANCYLNDDEYPANIFLSSTIKYKRLIIGPGIHIVSANEFFMKMGETVEDLVILRDGKVWKPEYALNADRVGFILAHMKNLKRLEIDWGFETAFLRKGCLTDVISPFVLMDVLKNVIEFKLFAQDVSYFQIAQLVNYMDNLENLYLEVCFTDDLNNPMFIQDPIKWTDVVKIVYCKKTTLKHLFVDFYHKDGKCIEPNKVAIVGEIGKMKGLKLKSFAIPLPQDCSILPRFLKYQSGITTFGTIFGGRLHRKAMPLSYLNLLHVVNHLPHVQHLFIDITGYHELPNLEIFNRLCSLKTLYVNVYRFETGSHAFHYEVDEIVPETVQPNLTSMSVIGMNSINDYRPSCNMCILYLCWTYPNLTYLELMLEPTDSLSNEELQIIFQMLPGLQVLGLTNCTDITDDALIGTHILKEGNRSKRVLIEERSISNLKRLHTLVISPAYNLTDVAFEHGISKLSTLKRFAIEGVSNISTTSVVSLANGCENLEYLQIGTCDLLEDKHVSFLLSRLKQLYMMKIIGSENFTGNLTKLHTGMEFHAPNTYIWRAHNVHQLDKVLPFFNIDV